MSFSAALDIATALRVPVFARDVPPAQRIAGLEEYMLVSAFHAGEINEERLGLLEQLKATQHEWDHLEGWETFRRNKTEAGVDDAKRQIRPDLYDRIRDLQWKVKRLTEEIDRLDRDSTKVSRVYTMMTGS